jgi:flavin-binding protein dodecin
MTGNTYKVIELVGSSREGIEDAIEGALTRASETLRHLDWFEVKEVRGMIENGRVGWYQVKLGVGFRVVEPRDLEKEA